MAKDDIFFEDSLREEWSDDLDVVEVPLEHRPARFLGIAAGIICLIVFVRVFSLNIDQTYTMRAFANLNWVERTIAPRGLILDRYGTVLAENKTAFSVLLNTREFLKQKERQDEVLQTIQELFDILPSEIRTQVDERARNHEGFSNPLVVRADISQAELVKVRAKNSDMLIIKNTFERSYLYGKEFASTIGYTGLLNSGDLLRNPDLTGEDRIGKAGLELTYDAQLRGSPGFSVELRDARGNILGAGDRHDPQIGKTLNTSLDAELQKYFYTRMERGLKDLDRTTGVALAMNPQNGEIISLISFPSFDNNAFVQGGRSAERKELLTSSLRPLFNRAVSGVYNPGSTIKPLHALAALVEGVVTPERTVFSPGYLDIPNPYNPSKPTRYVDWRFQGTINLYSAIAQSSNVYFYYVGGGAGDIKGLGISRLRTWWEKFLFGKPTGVDLPNEADGFLPSPEWKEKEGRGPWLLGDTYNVSIGQGDFSITPLQLLNYISAIANGGILYTPRINKDIPLHIAADFRSLAPSIKEVQEGMRETVQAKMGTARLLNDLLFPVAGKTGSAQVQNNSKENAFFVGYAQADQESAPEIAILVLIEHSREGSLNAVPIAKDVLNWYYKNRMKSKSF